MKSYKEDNNTTRIAVLETLAYETKQTLDKLETKMDEGFKEVNRNIISIHNRMWTNFLWTMGVFLTTFGGLIFTFAKMKT